MKALGMAAVLLFSVGGELWAQTEEAQPTDDRNEFTLEVMGHKGYPDIDLFKNRVIETLPGGTLLYEKRLTRGNIQFFLKTTLLSQELVEHLTALNLDNVPFQVTTQSENWIRVVLR